MHGPCPCMTVTPSATRDAKRYSDIYQPRIARTRSELMPGEAIVGDVHPLDILLSRADAFRAPMARPTRHE